MSWECDITEDAQKDLQALPHAIQKRVARVVDGMETDPFQGDVKPLSGPEWKGVSRTPHRLLSSAFYGGSCQEDGVRCPGPDPF